jgi:hypothetical protein
MRGDVRILPAAEFSEVGTTIPAAFKLRFPSGWRARPVQNRYAQTIGRETLQWLSRYGIGKRPEEIEKLCKFACEAYGGYSLPLASYQTGLLVTEFISLWLFWDDVQVEEGLGFSTEDVVAALVESSPPRSTSPYVAAWFDIGERLRRTQSRRWLSRLGASMGEWLENAKVETAMAMAHRRYGGCPDFEVLFECRTISIGMFPTFYLIEFAEGYELPDGVHDHVAVVALKRLAARLVGMGNDLGGIAKDVRNGWINLVLSLSERSRASIRDAFAAVIAIHNADVERFDRLAAELPGFGTEINELVQGWVQAVRYNVYGFALWESTAPRYQEFKAIAGNEALIAPVTAERPRVRAPLWTDEEPLDRAMF